MELLFSIKIEDYDDIIRIHNLYFHNKWSYQDIKTIDEIDNYSFMILKKNNKVAAYIILYDTIDSMDLFEIAVDEKYVRQGLGTVLLEELFQKYSQKDILLEVNEDNEKAIFLYKKNNFLPISIRKNYYKNNKNAIIMVRKYDT